MTTPDEYDVSYIDEDTTLTGHDEDYGHDEVVYSTPSRKHQMGELLQREWRRIPRNFSLVTFNGSKSDVLPFLDGLTHAFDTWGIDPRAQVQFAFAQLRDEAARTWMKKNPTDDFGSFRRKFVQRFGSHTLRRDALRALRDIRQVGVGNQGFVAAFERVLEELERHNLIIEDGVLLIFLQLAVNERVRDAVEWESFSTVRTALNKIANLTSGQGEAMSRAHLPRSGQNGVTARTAPASHQQPPRRFPSEAQGSNGGIPRRQCHGCGSEDHFIAHCPHRQGRTPPTGNVPFNNGRGHQGNGRRPKRW